MNDIERIFAERDWRDALVAEITRQELAAAAAEHRLRAAERRREVWRSAAVVCYILAGGATAGTGWLYWAHHPWLCLTTMAFAAFAVGCAFLFDDRSRK